MKKRVLKSLFSIMLAISMLVGGSLCAFAATAKIADEGVRIRSEASTAGEVVATGANGDSLEILETVSAGDGFTWYKVKTAGGTTGYVRGDLVRVVEDAPAAETNAEPNTASSLAPTEGTPINPVTATVAGNAAVNIRSGAGTGYAKVAALDAGTSITLVSEAADASGNKWYQLKCDSQNVEGYIRSDLITVNEEIVPASEEPVEEQPVEEQPVEEPVEEVVPENNDYEIVYTADDEGVYQYYLYDHVNNTRQKVTDLMTGLSTLNTKYQEANSKLSTFKIISIACGGLALVFFVLMIIFIIKNNNSSDDEYYEEDFEDEEEEEYEEEEEAPAPRKRPAPAPAQTRRPAPAPAPTRAARPARPAQNAQQSHRPRKVQNFLADDDEFEFEFLNMNDKD